MGKLKVETRKEHIKRAQKSKENIELLVYVE